MLSTVKALEMLPKGNWYAVISESFCFKLIYIYTINIQKTITFNVIQTLTKFLF